MLQLILEQLLLFIVSLVANVLSALAGGGAGLLQLPALIFLGLPFASALVTHKIASVALGLGASIKHSKSNNLDLKFSLLLFSFGIPGVIIGANIILTIPEVIAQFALGCLTMGLGIYSIYKKSLGQSQRIKNRELKGLLVGGSVLFVLGIINGSLTSGTGLFVTLWLITWFGLDYKSALAHTMLLVGLFWNGTGALTLALLTEPKWQWLPVLILASMLGGYIGSHVALQKGNPFIKKVFEMLTILMGIALIMSALNQ